jgi:hypothetical protein
LVQRGRHEPRQYAPDQLARIFDRSRSFWSQHVGIGDEITVDRGGYLIAIVTGLSFSTEATFSLFMPVANDMVQVSGRD